MEIVKSTWEEKEERERVSVVFDAGEAGLLRFPLPVISGYIVTD